MLCSDFFYHIIFFACTYSLHLLSSQPDLGKDLVREFWYDKESGRIGCEINTLPSGLSTGKPDGPRYFEFHPKFNIAYVVNELSSTVSHFSVMCAQIYVVHSFRL